MHYTESGLIINCHTCAYVCHSYRDFADDICRGKHDCSAVQSISDCWQLRNVVVSYCFTDARCIINELCDIHVPHNIELPRTNKHIRLWSFHLQGKGIGYCRPYH